MGAVLCGSRAWHPWHARDRCGRVSACLLWPQALLSTALALACDAIVVNRAVHTGLTKALREKERMDAAELSSYLGRVVVRGGVHGCPATRPVHIRRTGGLTRARPLLQVPPSLREFVLHGREPAPAALLPAKAKG